MMNKISIFSKVVNGNLQRNKAKILQAIKSFDGKEIEIIIKRKRKSRSNPQNAYYFGVIIPITQRAINDEWGEIWSIQKTHEFLKNMFLYEERTNHDTSEIIKIPKSTTENSTLEQEMYHTQIRNFLLEWFNVNIPLPNEHINFD